MLYSIQSKREKHEERRGVGIITKPDIFWKTGKDSWLQGLRQLLFKSLQHGAQHLCSPSLAQTRWYIRLYSWIHLNNPMHPNITLSSMRKQNIGLLFASHHYPYKWKKITRKWRRNQHSCLYGRCRGRSLQKPKVSLLFFFFFENQFKEN